MLLIYMVSSKVLNTEEKKGKKYRKRKKEGRMEAWKEGERENRARERKNSCRDQR